MFNDMDVNGNKYLSLAEIDKGMRDVLQLNDEFFDMKQVFLKSFQQAKSCNKYQSQYGDDYIEQDEFLYFLCYLEQYFSYYLVFQMIDKSKDKRISYEEFKQSLQKLKKFHINLEDENQIKQEFQLIDQNKGGFILFDEFCDWAFKKSISLIDNQEEQIEIYQNIKEAQQIKKQNQEKNTKKQQKNQQFLQQNQKLLQKDIDLLKQISKKLPISDSSQDQEKRKKLFKNIDINSSGHLSLAEIDKGIQDELKIPVVFQMKPVIIRAFNASKNVQQDQMNSNQDYIELSEFQYFLSYLKQFFEYYLMFQHLDKNGDHKINFQEFQASQILLKKYGVTLEKNQFKQEFQKIDKNKGNYILFNEFCQWAIYKSLKINQENIENNKFQLKSEQAEIISQPIQKKVNNNQNLEKAHHSQYTKHEQEIQEIMYKIELILPINDKVSLKNVFDSIDYIQKDRKLSVNELDSNFTPKISQFYKIKIPYRKLLKTQDKQQCENEILKEKTVIKTKNNNLIQQKLPQQIKLNQQKEKILNLAQKLPTKDNLTDKKARQQLFSKMDTNGNKILSLAEVDKGIQDILKLDEVFKNKQVIIRAFQAAKNCCQTNNQNGEDYIEIEEFQYYLIYIQQFFEYFCIFSLIDTDNDHRISLSEFKKSYNLLKKFGLNIQQKDLDLEFKKIDENQGGFILFDEFCAWAINKSIFIIKQRQNQQKEIKDGQKAKIAQKDQQKNTIHLDLTSVESYKQIQQNKKESLKSVRKQLNQQELKQHQKIVEKQKSSSNLKSKSIISTQSSRYKTNYELIYSKSSKSLKTLDQLLPISDSSADNSRRIRLFKNFDPNGNGFLSLAEVQKGIRDNLQIDFLYNNKQVIIRAFQAAKNICKSNSKYGQDYIEINEFKYFLTYLRQFYEFYEMFSIIDTNQDKTITKDELQKALPFIKQLGLDEGTADSIFDEIDYNKGGKILFDEFCKFVIEKSLTIKYEKSNIQTNPIHLKSSQVGVQKSLPGKQSYRNLNKKKEILTIKTINYDWQQQFDQKLPLNKPEIIQQVWQSFDINNNKLLSLAEVDKGIQDILQIPQIFKCKKPIIRSFQAAKKITQINRQEKENQELKNQQNIQNEYIDEQEFQYFIVFLRLFFEYWLLFSAIDEDGDKRIDIQEFKKSIPILNKWIKNNDISETNENIEKIFNDIDKNQGGYILFDEFCDYFVKNYLQDQQQFSSILKIQNHNFSYIPHKGKIKSLKEMEEIRKEEQQQIFKKQNLKFSIKQINDIKNKIPTKFTHQSELQRQKLFKQFDFNNNNILSLAEIQKGVRDVLKIKQLFDSKQVMLKAYNLAKNLQIDTNQSDINENFIEQGKEFHYLLIYLLQYFEYWLLFDTLDVSSDGRISFKEFQKSGDLLQKYISITYKPTMEEFKKIDKNKGGYILFEEFCDYVIQKSILNQDKNQNQNNYQLPNSNQKQNTHQTPVKNIKTQQSIDLSKAKNSNFKQKQYKNCDELINLYTDNLQQQIEIDINQNNNNNPEKTQIYNNILKYIKEQQEKLKNFE